MHSAPIADQTASLDDLSAWNLPLAATAGAILSSALYLPVVESMARQWWNDPNWGHGFLVPLFSAWVLWRERRRWRSVEIRPAWSGLLGMALAIALLLAGSLAAELFTARLSLVLLLGAMVVYLAGWRMLREALFPLCFLLLMIPWPAMIYSQVTLPLQFLASRLGAWSLQLVHVPVLREGNLLYFASYTLDVAEACSGIRSLVSLFTLVVAYAYLAERRLWVRLALLAFVVPVAITSNAFRIFAVGALAAAVSPRLAQGFFHQFSGGLVFLAAVAAILALHRMLLRAAAPRLAADA